MLHAEWQAKKFVMRQWKRGMGKQQQERAVLFSVLVKIMSVRNVRLQQIVLAEWLRAVRTQRRMFKFSSKVQLRRQRRWFWLWQTWVLMRKRHRQDTDEAAGYQQQRLLSTVFFAWQNYALAWKDAKDEAQMSTHRKNWNKVAPLSTSTEEEADQASFRRPLSPIMKRHRAKQQSKMLNADEAIASASEPKLSLSDAASLTLDVKKRLIVLGKWKPYHKSLDQT
ncbi:hypothetical protein Poli38472_012682 [Pythium oligandrum]|uniref:Uncharacterized protein n=1 Tax=Pythium oligandrum TaxID=41045 RepID=A0A8K1CDN6_PYTOL|nr:hypothetical protein Poli38472_012682 [Pythium oligandrum]|eukprot:TMW61491.1 hypothetical protein Poli38472_012682 [Pythium oligandrum]